MRFGDLAAHVFFTETGSPLPKRPRAKSRQVENLPHGGKKGKRQVENLPHDKQVEKLHHDKQVKNLLHGGRYSPLLGVHQGRAIYLLFNGVLGDRRPAGGNVLTHDVAQHLPEHPDGHGVRVVYGEACRLGAKSLERYGITFRQIPFELKVD